MEDLRLEMRNDKSKEWHETTMENFLEVIEITRNMLQENSYAGIDATEYEEKVAIWAIQTGRIVHTPVLSFRLAEGETCPKCGVKFILELGALSRRDNKTKICSPCGLREAIEDMKASKKEKS